MIQVPLCYCPVLKPSISPPIRPKVIWPIRPCLIRFLPASPACFFVLSAPAAMLVPPQVLCTCCFLWPEKLLPLSLANSFTLQISILKKKKRCTAETPSSYCLQPPEQTKTSLLVVTIIITNSRKIVELLFFPLARIRSCPHIIHDLQIIVK